MIGRGNTEPEKIKKSLTYIQSITKTRKHRVILFNTVVSEPSKDKNKPRQASSGLRLGKYTPVMESTWAQPSFRPRSFSRSVSPASMAQGSSKNAAACRYFAAGSCSAGSTCAFSHASPARVPDECSDDDFPDMSHITSSMDQLAFLDDEILNLPTGRENSKPPFSAFGNFDFGRESIFAPGGSGSGGKQHKSLLPSFLLDELGGSGSGEEEKVAAVAVAAAMERQEGCSEPVVFFERPLSAAPVLTSSPSTSSSSSSPAPSASRTSTFSYGDALRLGASATSLTESLLPANANVYSIQPEPLVEPDFDEFEEVDPVGYRSCGGSVSSTSEELCAFSIMGKCRYGNYCRNLHGLQCPRCLLYILHPTDTERNEAHLSECFSKPESTSFSNLHQIKCGLCDEAVLQKVDPRFGLLNCSHPFCLTCIRSWRASNFDANDADSRSCPLCTEVTYFIVPSSTWIEDSAEKQKVIEQYKKKMSMIPCKYHDSGRGNCPFGSSCFYEHRNEYAPESPADAAKAAYRQAISEQNERLAKVREAKLSDYIVFKSVPSFGKKIKKQHN